MASESALEILTDILDDFNTKFCQLLRMAVDNEALNGRTGFPVSEQCTDNFNYPSHPKTGQLKEKGLETVQPF